MSADQEKEEHMVTRLSKTFLILWKILTKSFLFDAIIRCFRMRDAGMPADLVNKLFRMLQDIEINKDLNSTFKTSIGSNNNMMAGIILGLIFYWSS